MLRRFSIWGASVLLTSCSGNDPAATANSMPEPAQNSPAAAPALARKPAPVGATVYIIEPADGAIVENPVRVVFGLTGAGVIPAGIAREGAGHHHLLVDTGLPNLALPIPADDSHRHFGGGQTEAELNLNSGMHTLQLLLGDEIHVPHDPAIASEVIRIEVR